MKSLADGGEEGPEGKPTFSPFFFSDPLLNEMRAAALIHCPMSLARLSALDEGAVIDLELVRVELLSLFLVADPQRHDVFTRQAFVLWAQREAARALGASERAVGAQQE